MTPTREDVERLAELLAYQVPGLDPEPRDCRHAAAMLRALLARAEAAEAELAVEQEARELASESDAGWEQVANAARAECERLRLGGCARGQTTTQWCAEAVQMMTERDAARAEAARLREALVKARGYLRPPPGSHYPHGVTYAVQAIDAALATEARDE